MDTITLYRTHRTGGGIDVSPVKPESGEYETLYRLIADDGCMLVNGNGDTTECIDTEDVSQWTEVGGAEETINILLGGESE